MNRRRVLLLVAAIVAALGTALVFLYVKGADTRAEQRFDTVEVLRAVTQIEAGETIEAASKSGKLQLQPVAQDALLPGYQTDTASLDGLVAMTTIYPGEQIISGKFGGVSDAETSALTIPKGMMAISVNLTDPARVAGFVNPGSEVSIFLSGQDEKSGPFTRLMLDRVQVLGVGSTTPVSTTTKTEDGAAVTEQLPNTLLTLAVDKEDAERILYASSNGELAFGLLTKDSSVSSGAGVTERNLFK